MPKSPPPLFADLETYCETPISCGTHRYAEDAEVLLFAWAIGDGPVNVWDLTTGAPMPDALSAALDDPQVMTVWHNGGMFDSVVLQHTLGIDIPLERIHDTMAQAYAHSLPGSLGALCEVLNVPTHQAKDKTGRQLVNLFCKPQSRTHKIRRPNRDTHPEEWQHFIEYAAADIEAMRVIWKRMPRWNLTPFETTLWRLDQRINRRGMCMDMALAESAMATITEEKKHLDKRTEELTDGEVGAATRRDAMLKHIVNAFGITLPDMQKSTLERRINDPNLPTGLRELLIVRLQSCTTSTSKYETLLKSVSRDGRLRGTKQFCGASRTGRWAGRLFQPDNLPRPSMSQAEIDLGIKALKKGVADLAFDVMSLTSSALRACIRAPEGKKLVVSDLSNIEGRVLAWLAGEEWKLQAFRDDDAGIGDDLYKLAYAKAFHISPSEVTKAQRQVGKVMELGLGYGGGVAAFLTFALAYGLDLDALADAALPTIPATIIRDARSWYAESVKRKKTYGLTERVFVACDSIKRLWRNAHPKTVSFWRALEDGVRHAIEHPGCTLPCRRVKIRRDGAWLRIALPSGRVVCYPGAAIVKGDVTYMGMDPYSRKWDRLKTYGGRLVENLSQGLARDVLAAAMPVTEEHGYEIVLTVHDEVVCEAPDTDDYTHDKLNTLLATNPHWADDLPLNAGGFEAPYYRKE